MSDSVRKNFFDIGELTQEFEDEIKPENCPPARYLEIKSRLAIAQQLAVMNSHLAKIERALSGKRK
jgi:hypothetical protein